MAWKLPEGWPAQGELDGKPIDLEDAARTLPQSRLEEVVVDVPGKGKLRPWRFVSDGEDIEESPEGRLRL